MADAGDSFDQAEHDYQYSPSRWSTRGTADEVISMHCETLATESARAREEAAGHSELNVPYMADDAQFKHLTLDLLFPAPENGSPSAPDHAIVVYIHGGMWQALSKADSAFMAPPLNAAGVTVAAVEYELTPKATMAQIVEQCARAVAFVHHRYPQARLYVLGHSAGGHLAAMMLTMPWADAPYNAPELRICGCIPVSGLFDLAPVQRCYANEAMRLTTAEIAQCSPQALAAAAVQRMPHCRMLLAVAERDTLAFRQQSIVYRDALRAAGDFTPTPLQWMDMAERDHFDIIERLRLADDPLTRAVLDLIAARS